MFRRITRARPAQTSQPSRTFDPDAPETSGRTARLTDFAYLGETDIYLDAGCQSLRPQPVIDALAEYYTQYNACGGRVKYAWGRRVDAEVADTRRAVLDLLGLSSRTHAVSFTLNTTYGLNLLLTQLPTGRYQRVLTSHIEHNSVFLPTIAAATRLGVPRIVLDRAPDGGLVYAPHELDNAVIVVSAASNIDGRLLTNLAALVDDAHARGGIVIVDAAQAIAHSAALLRGTGADAVCFSAHKMYGASLGVVVATTVLLRSLDISFLGGGMVSDVREDSYDLVPDDPGALLEPGLQAWGEIIALHAAITWAKRVRLDGLTPDLFIERMSRRLFEGLRELPGVTMVNAAASPVVSLYVDGQDSHRLAVFLSKSGIMVRSGYFCAHHYLKEQLGLPPLLRFSLGLHTTESDIDRALECFARLLKGLS
ncbi:cysteine desulfurase/selenocysteine lyase [Glaciihabitans tibetensis]|uniref:Cysteine desulfurase/selenocysteine lyase n=1 Tax=Glaciihabitans tibetensis TaxID=1266600 RepID=A0A2T0VK81_9MICO|nr:aminotransferase class V-fold PLP-dependent enzyme [Glaciihabitans tibetensis]PRY70593.1 cysteine desulfurase/selenocysteine lyase [Glaciihabitans tibetensis]